MHIKKNDTPLWTGEFMEHYKKYRDVYGPELNGAEFAQKINALSGRRYAAETECFDIYTETGELAGDITLTPLQQIPELGIAIFDKYAGRGYAQRALAAVIDDAKTKFKTIEAVIKSTNPNREGVRHILENAGFVCKCRLPGGGLFFVLDL